MRRCPLPLLAVTVAVAAISCAAPLNVDTVSFKPPTAYPDHQVLDGLEIALRVVDGKQDCKEIFGTDLKRANVLPVQLVVRNAGQGEFEIDHTQIFGVTPEGEYSVAYTLGRAAQRVRASSIGTTAVAGATAGALVGAAAGAAAGAAVGHAVGETGTGAATGAALGGATGATAGLGEGLSDSFTFEFKKQLATHAFEDRVIYPGDLQQGFIYLKWQPYQAIRMKVFDITQNRIHELVFAASVSR